ncbi:ATP-binding cassette domain-containing protein [Bacteriovorax sp. PP10]|uniref:ATP-binding cassette domain-containing protein n=1 Tax=Bacteriovorax antarcticus TaxID=3088717 RepID=A0ABU5VT73_9BACT|nr:ATP-binding cassette domain-containing protein [Bacteriovorax sp. PP10]MEA9355583.1 ATP-binding cassette domain-containing protein [Bacteriovorax sp. PP10]
MVDMLNQSKNLNQKNMKAPQGQKGPIFYCEDVSVQFDEILALKNVQLTIERGEIIFLTGASGAGKTTLLKVLSGLQNPTSGKVIRPDFFSGKKNLFISNVFQDLRLMGKYTCEENLQFAYDSSIYASKAEFNQDMNELSRILGIKDRLHLKINDANGGLKQKVAIIRALLTRPDVLIADEPTSSLDIDNTRRLFDVLNLYNVKRGLTVVWATHNKDLIKSFTGRIIHLDNGRLVYSGNACFI